LPVCGPCPVRRSRGRSGPHKTNRFRAPQQLPFFGACATPYPMGLMCLKRKGQARLPDLAAGAYGLCLGNLLLGGAGCRNREEQIRISGQTGGARPPVGRVFRRSHLQDPLTWSRTIANGRCLSAADASPARKLWAYSCRAEKSGCGLAWARCPTHQRSPAETRSPCCGEREKRQDSG
jgi:hypothetical protein